jgi:hypothetical protein
MHIPSFIVHLLLRAAFKRATKLNLLKRLVRIITRRPTIWLDK